MVQRTVVSVITSERGEKPKSERFPIEEGMQKLSTNPIWVHIDDTESLKQAFVGLRTALIEGGLRIASDVQSDPHGIYRLLDFFEVRQHLEGRREDELLGMVSLYGQDESPRIIKISLDDPIAGQTFIRALESAIPEVVAKAKCNLEVTIAEGPEPKT